MATGPVQAARLKRRGRTQKEIAEQLGVSLKTVRRWLNPAEAEADRASARAYKAANRERLRAYDASYSENHRGTCETCGGQMGRGCPADGICAACRSKAADATARRVVAMWAEGATIPAIATELGWSQNTVGMMMHHYRSQGYNLPYRRVGPNQPGMFAAMRPNDDGRPEGRPSRMSYP